MKLVIRTKCLVGMERAPMNSMATNRQRHPGADGFTLVEVMVAMLIAALVSAGVIHSVILVKHLNQANEQRAVAFNLCKSRIESLISIGYDSLPVSTVESNLPMTHLGEVARNELTGTRRTTVTTATTPIEHKVIQADVTWSFRNSTLTETATATVYRK